MACSRCRGWLRTNPPLRRVLLKSSPRVGTVLGTHFYLQAAGYVAGQSASGYVSANNTCGLRPAGLLDSSIAGAQHLMHVFLPFTPVAVPLGPLLCGLLLMYVLYLPATLQAPPNSSPLNRTNAWFLSLIFAVATTTIGGTWLVYFWSRPLDPWSWPWPWPVFPFNGQILTLLYILLLARGTSLAQMYISPWLLRHMQGLARTYPFSQLFVGGIVALLLLLAYAGGRFDGYMDGKRGICAVAGTTSNPSLVMAPDEVGNPRVE